MASYWGNADDCYGMYFCYKIIKEIPICRSGIILVPWDPCTGNRIVAGWQSGHGRSIYLYTFDRVFPCCCMGNFRYFKKVALSKIYFGTSAAIILIALTWNTSLQLKNWKNSITLFEHAVNVTKNNFGAESNLGTAYSLKDLDKALFHYKAALKLNRTMPFHCI